MLDPVLDRRTSGNRNPCAQVQNVVSSSLMRRPSAAAVLLGVAGIKALLRKLDFMQRIARGEHVLAED